MPCQNVVVQNCNFANGHGGITIGSEMTGGVRNVYARDLAMNSPNLHRKVTADNGRAAELAKSNKSPREIVEEIYLSVYTRPPGDDERRIAEALFAEPGTTRRRATEDRLWALVNTPEFVFKD